MRLELELFLDKESCSQRNELEHAIANHDLHCDPVPRPHRIALGATG